ncbi:uncharacterized protein K452DRAFT_343978 [Aplosporella prunicola CBS 121167]|uniref:Uncharacterized protein n=1 Tax=Aplosporella prunicola CBS 121167 TaxID=1176127 RepID=A0A6A6AWJ4_9PEZI|nr:uncharacterized protein K452DRAFT_343978 [Aplosporella prunicola CBS 121167]KAF2136372.1 hypothetical protein K452DRAFT_343978 [Aplosporella prunicola CBS 121167]
MPIKIFNVVLVVLSSFLVWAYVKHLLEHMKAHLPMPTDRISLGAMFAVASGATAYKVGLMTFKFKYFWSTTTPEKLITPDAAMDVATLLYEAYMAMAQVYAVWWLFSHVLMLVFTAFFRLAEALFRIVAYLIYEPLPVVSAEQAQIDQAPAMDWPLFARLSKLWDSDDLKTIGTFGGPEMANSQKEGIVQLS